MKITVFNIDLDIDSDNTGTLDESEVEDLVEFVPPKQNPGKILAVNKDDKDDDGVIDYADWEIKETAQGGFNENIFAEIKLKLSEGVALDDCLISISYSASDPLDKGFVQTGQLPKGRALRLWKKPSNTPRNPASIKNGGDFIPAMSNDTYSLSDIFGSGSTTTQGNRMKIRSIAELRLQDF